MKRTEWSLIAFMGVGSDPAWPLNYEQDSAARFEHKTLSLSCYRSVEAGEFSQAQIGKFLTGYCRYSSQSPIGTSHSFGKAASPSQPIPKPSSR